MNHTSKTKQCLVALKWTILVAQKLILLLLMWPFPLPQSKSAQKKEVSMRIQEQLQEMLRLINDKHSVWRRQKWQLLLSPNQVPSGAGCGAPWLCLLLPKTHAKHPKQSTRWFLLWRKRWKGLQTATGVTQGGENNNNKLLWRRSSSRKHARQAEWVQARSRRDTEKSSRNVNFLLYSNDVLLRSQEDDTQKESKTWRHLTSKLKGSTERMRDR